VSVGELTLSDLYNAIRPAVDILKSFMFTSTISRNTKKILNDHPHRSRSPALERNRVWQILPPRGEAARWKDISELNDLLHTGCA